MIPRTDFRWRRRPVVNRKRRQAVRRLRVEQLEPRQMLDGDPVTLVDDAFDLRQNGPQVALDVLANDLFDGEYGGPQLITSVSYGSEGGRITIAPDRGSILYTPPADFFGVETFVYAVDGQFTAQVEVSIRAPLAFDNYEIPPDGLVHQLAVLANDPFWSGYQGPRRITAVSVGSAGGTVVIAPGGQSVLYTPPDGAFGKETFIYVVDNIYPAQVTITIPQTLAKDKFEIIQHAPPQTFHVLANDPFWANYPGERRITHVIGGQAGAVEIAPDGKSIIYTAGEGSRTDSFRYVVDGTYEANVTVRIHRPVRDDSFQVDRNSTNYFYNVTANDTYRDLDNVVHDVIDRVTSVTQPESGGTVLIAAGGQGILYTPPAGFTGSDRFTYLADGVHAATVFVEVTLPVRNDSFSSGVYQDTPTGVLDVLANDFVGNGYTGPRLITSVGPTENGGTLTIRSDGKAILYTPAAGYVGSDRFTYTVDGELEAEVYVYVRPLATGDSYEFAPHPVLGPFTLYVLSNDYFNLGYAGPGVITAASVTSGGGAVTIQNGQSLRFAPGMVGSHSLRYTVDGKYEANVSVWFPNFLASDRAVADQNSPAQRVDVLANDFAPSSQYAKFKSQDYPGPRRITSATQSLQGGVVTVAADGLSVNYTPPADFYGQDRFTYTVDGIMTATATVEVIRRVRDDQFRVGAADGQQALPVLVNDLFGANYSGPGQITAVTATSAGGTATIAADGRSILYTSAAGFHGTDTFTYTVDGALKAEVSVVVDAPASEQVPTFASIEEYTQFLIDDALIRYQYLFGQIAWDYVIGGPDYGGAPNASPEDRGHSETNVQVAGVDEGDIVEFDADYVYVLTDDDVVIVDAWPAEELAIASRVDIEGRTIAMFLHGDRLTVISETGGGFRDDPWLIDGVPRGPADFFWPPWPIEPFTTIVTVLDVSDRIAPSVVQTTEMEGRYVDSRGVGDFVYVLVNNADAVGPKPQIIDEDNDPTTPNRYETQEEYLARVTANPGQFVEAALPNYSAYGSDGELVRTGLLNSPEDIYRPLVPDAMSLISVVSFNVEANDPGLADTSAVYSTGASAIYASLENFYVFDSDYSPEDGAITRIAKFDWEPATGGVDFAATTTVAGRILNQFSADENGPYLRIATTVSNDYSGNWSGRAENMLFVLQEDDGVFEFVGSLQNLALNETMRSVRFLGDRAFVSTFREIDPLFAIDLTDPANPESVGHITLPGFTSYMHLVGANHLLTVGRNTPGGTNGPTQVALFDISDLTQPLRIAEYTFERFSTSEAELDHHAFGYYAEHGLLGMPVSRTYYVRVDLDGDGYRETSQAVTENELAVFTVDVAASEPGDRLALAGEIAHEGLVRRSGYIGDKLYSIANDSVKVVDVTAPNDVIGELVIDTGEEVQVGLPIGEFALLTVQGAESTTTPPPPPTESERLAASVERARIDLADRLGIGTGAPMFITAEATPDAPGGGYCLVFRVGDEHYLYRASSRGVIEFVRSDFEFAGGGGGAWHAVDFAVAPPPTALPGDFNVDGRVDQLDYAAWKAGFGTVSLSAFHPVDGNRDGIVNAADYTTWRNNLGRVAGDYNGNGAVGQEDYAYWKANFGATSGPGLAADGNGNGVVDAGDYVVWQNMVTMAGGAAATGGSGASTASASEQSTVAAEPAVALSVSADAAVTVDDRVKARSFVPVDMSGQTPRPAAAPVINSTRLESSMDRGSPRVDLLLLATEQVAAPKKGDELSDGAAVGRPTDDSAATVDAAFAVLSSGLKWSPWGTLGK